MSPEEYVAWVGVYDREIGGDGYVLGRPGGCSSAMT
jgi:hypothetical protein